MSAAATGEATTGGTGARPGAVGFLTDASLCIGCKACEVACKQWNRLPADGSNGGPGLTGFSYDNTGDLGATTWRHVAFVEKTLPPQEGPLQGLLTAAPVQTAWLMLSDVCKHCVNAPCLDACPTGAIDRTRFDTVVIQDDVCNGCGYCVPARTIGVTQLGQGDRTAHKCTLCYDRLVDGLEPACAKACPTDSIRFGPIGELLPRAAQRVEELKARGIERAQVYGDRSAGGTGGIDGLNALFVLTDSPETFNLPAAPRRPSDAVLPAFLSTAAAALGLGLATVAALRRR